MFYDKYFVSILILYTLLDLIARVVYLGVVFTNEEHEFDYSLFTEDLPWIVKAQTVLFVCKFKAHIFYVAR